MEVVMAYCSVWTSLCRLAAGSWYICKTTSALQHVHETNKEQGWSEHEDSDHWIYVDLLLLRTMRHLHNILSWVCILLYKISHTEITAIRNPNTCNGVLPLTCYENNHQQSEQHAILKRTWDNLSCSLRLFSLQSKDVCHMWCEGQQWSNHDSDRTASLKIARTCEVCHKRSHIS